uniref:Sulfotransferase n=1 Tax=Zea mays TaxID=4577 RepID=C0PKJ0_MAIZE|nr:unknown [Zea mays]|eukprot:NP_001170073.1 uncharacterized protein LOC100383989 [Zea mays]
MAQVPSESSKSDAETSPPADKAPPEISSPECYSDLVSTRPARGGWVQPLVLYQNYWLTPGRLQHIIPVKELYKPRADDIVLVTYPKCGTTWLKALAFAITTRSRHAFAAHPLLARHPQELVPHLELPALAGDLADVEKLAALPEASRDSPTPFPAPAGRVRLPRRVPVPASQGRLRLVVVLRERHAAQRLLLLLRGPRRRVEHVLRGVLAVGPLLGALPRVLEGELGEASAYPVLEVRRDRGRPGEGCQDACRLLL